MTTMFPSIQAPPVLRCYACGHDWYQRGPKPPDKCPNCQSRTWFNPTSIHRRGRKFHPRHHPVEQTLPGLIPGTTVSDGTQPAPEIPQDADPGPLPEKEDA